MNVETVDSTATVIGGWMVFVSDRGEYEAFALGPKPSRHLRRRAAKWVVDMLASMQIEVDFAIVCHKLYTSAHTRGPDRQQD